MAQNEENHDGGYILLARKIRENPIYSNSTALHIWIECLLRASFKKREFFSKREKVNLNAGEFLMGYREFSRAIGCSVSTVKYWIDTFFAERLIERQANAKGTKITVLKWKDYQDAERFTVRQANAKRTLSESNKKGKNEKNEKTVAEKSFSLFWNGYDKKVGDKAKCQKKWLSLSVKTHEKILSSLPAFVADKPERQFRPNPSTYLNQERWNDEIYTPETDGAFKKEFENLGEEKFREKYRIFYKEQQACTCTVKERSELKHLQLTTRIRNLFSS